MFSIGNSIPNYHHSTTSSRDGRSKSRKRSATTNTPSAIIVCPADSLTPQCEEAAPSPVTVCATPVFSSTRPPTAPSSRPESGMSALGDLLEPAVDGPPSPQHLRALTNQMRQASLAASRSSSSSGLERASLSRHGPTSSASSLRSFVSSSGRPSSGRPSSGRQSWDHLNDPCPSLSRRSSARSTTSSMRLGVKERPDSIHMFGKSIFPRRGRLRRESSDHSTLSSHSVSFSQSDIGVQNAEPSESSRFPAIFARRRSVKTEDSVSPVTSAPARKLTISGPYNFQHLTHTNRDQLPGLPASSRVELVNEFASFNSAHRTAAMPAMVDNPSPIKFKTDCFTSLPSRVEEMRKAQHGHSMSVDSHSVRRPPMKTMRSSDHLPSPIPPPRPPRPAECLLPLLNSPLVSPPLPPPRMSSRSSNHSDSIETTFDRPSTASGSLCLPEAMSASLSGMPSFSHAITTPDDVAWPMPSPSPSSPLAFDKLADVPEEDEYFGRSRFNIVSARSSLRASASAPMLKQLCEEQELEMEREEALRLQQEEEQRQLMEQEQTEVGYSDIIQEHYSGYYQDEPLADIEEVESPLSPKRPASSGSDTLGFLCRAIDAAAAAVSQSAEAGNVEGNSPINWEDDIDYAYEHEVEADCSYEWRRTSLDIRIERENSMEPEEQPVEAVLSAHIGLSHAVSGLSVFSPVSDVPSLGLSSPATTDICSPLPTSTPCISNFSLPRGSHGRSNSAVSNFRESQGFTLSPSLLIPEDFREQMMLSDMDDVRMSVSYGDSDALFIHDPRTNFEYKTNTRKNRISSVYRPSVADRTSTSTMMTLSTIASSEASILSTVSASLSAERHISSSTTMTRMTFNSDIMGDWSPVSDSGVVLGIEPTEMDYIRYGSSTGDLPATATASKPMAATPMRRRAMTTSLAAPSMSISPSYRMEHNQI